MCCQARLGTYSFVADESAIISINVSIWNESSFSVAMNKNCRQCSFNLIRVFVEDLEVDINCAENLFRLCFIKSFENYSSLSLICFQSCFNKRKRPSATSFLKTSKRLSVKRCRNVKHATHLYSTNSLQLRNALNPFFLSNYILLKIRLTTFV